MTATNSQAVDVLLQRGMDLIASGDAADAVPVLRAAIAAAPTEFEAHHALVRALRDAGQREESVATALALTALTPNDPLAHTALSISLQHVGHIAEAEAAAARARILEWKIQLQSPTGQESNP